MVSAARARAGSDAAGVFVTQGVDAGSGEREFLAPDALHFGYPGGGIELGYGEKLVAGLFDRVSHPQPVEQRALGVLLAGGDFDQVPSEMASNRRLPQAPMAIVARGRGG